MHGSGTVVWTPDPTREEESGEFLARKCLAGMQRMPQLLNSATDFLFKIFNVIGQALLQYPKFLCFTVYSRGGIPALKTLPGKVFPLADWLAL